MNRIQRIADRITSQTKTLGQSLLREKHNCDCQEMIDYLRDRVAAMRDRIAFLELENIELKRKREQ